MLFLICIYVLCAIVTFFLLWRYKVEKSVEFLPGPRTFPVVGSMFELLGDQEHLWHKLREYNKLYYPIFRFVLPNFIIVTLLNPEDIEILFTSINHIEKSIVYYLIKRWLREGLLISFGKKWQKRRKVLTPGFHFNILNKYSETFLERAHLMVDTLKKEKGDRIKNLETWVSEHTLAVICETAMGCSANIFEKEEGITYKKAVNFMGQTLMHRIIRPWVFPDTLFSLTNLGKRHNDAVDTLHDFSMKIIKEAVKNAENKDAEKLISEHETKKKATMLDILIESYKRGEIDELGIQEEVDTFVFEGYDTTAMAMIYTILCLGEYKDIQDRVREEVNGVWKECDGNITAADIQKLSYLERVIKETLRMYPSVPIIARNITEDLKLKNCVIPKGVLINVHIFEVHRDPKHWVNPDKFDPDRFLPENSKGRHAFAYIPFSGGYRNCIGQKFAMNELKTMIGFLVRHFYIQPIDSLKDIKSQADLVLRPKVPLHAKFVPIEH